MKQVFIVNDERSRFHAKRAVEDLPLDRTRIVTIQNATKRRSESQNRMQWAGMLEDFAQQARLSNRLFSAKVWHELLKEKFLPEHFNEGVTLRDYVKWIEMPDGNLKMVGSTTMLTTKGFSDYIEQCYAFGCDLDVKFTTVRYAYTKIIYRG